MKTLPTRFTTLAFGLALGALTPAFGGDGAAKFKLMDTDGDGRITRAEHAAGGKQMFQQADTNGDGVLTPAEIAVVHNSRADSTARETSSTRGDPKAATRDAEDLIKLIDQDGDGRLTRAEHDVGSASIFARMDANGDGALSAVECDEGHESLKAAARSSGATGSKTLGSDATVNATTSSGQSTAHEPVQSKPIDK